MLIYKNEAIDWEKWDRLLDKSQAEIFNYSFYIQAVSEMQVLFLDESGENGIVFSYNQKLNIQQIYTPPFGRQTDFIGSDSAFQQTVFNYLHANFKVANFGCSVKNEGLPFTPALHQVIFEKTRLNSLAKRSLKKAIKAGVEIRELDSYVEILNIVSTEIGQKVKEINPKSMKLLAQLCANLKNQNRLKIWGIFQNNRLEGGQLFMDSAHKRIYLKGACLAETKKNGGMYLCMYEAIENTLLENKSVDFGGSNVPGVKQFNLNFGSHNEVYYRYHWNHAGNLYKLLQAIKHKVKS